MMKSINQVMQWLIYYKLYGGMIIYHDFFAKGIHGTYIFENQSTTQTSVPECDPSRNSAWYEHNFERI